MQHQGFFGSILREGLNKSKLELPVIGISGYFFTYQKDFTELVTPNLQRVQPTTTPHDLIEKDKNVYIGCYGKKFNEVETAPNYILYYKVVAQKVMELIQEYLAVYTEHFSKRVIDNEKLLNNSLTKSKLGELISEIEIATYLLTVDNLTIIGKQISNILQQIIYIIGARAVLENGIVRTLFLWNIFHNIYG